MKKLSIVFLLIICILFTACAKDDLAASVSNDLAAEVAMEQLIEVLEAEDKKALKEMFTEAALEEIEDFDAAAEKLFAYFEGDVVSYETEMTGGGDAMEYGVKVSDSGYIADVETTESVYRLGLTYQSVWVYGVAKGGIGAVCIIKEEKAEYEDGYLDRDEDYGIFIEQHYIEIEDAAYREELDKIFLSIKNKDTDAMLELFSKNVKNTVDDLGLKMNELFAYVSEPIKSYEYWIWDDYKKDCYTLDVQTGNGKYCFAIIYNEDTWYEDNYGLESLYVVEDKDNSILELGYWGDGNDTPGIHVGVENTCSVRTTRRVNMQAETIAAALYENDQKKLESVFSNKCRESTENFSDSVRAFMDYYQGEPRVPYDLNERLIVYESGNKIIRSMDFSSDEMRYRAALVYVENPSDADEEKIEALYIVEEDKLPNPEESYWGDKQDRPGIHVDVVGPVE